MSVIRHGSKVRPSRCRSTRAEPDVVGIGHHERTPVVEDLQPAEQNVGFLDIDPVVLDQLLPCGDTRP